MIDPVAIIRAVLANPAGVLFALVGDNIREAPVVFDKDSKAVVFHCVGGLNDLYVPVHQVSIYCRCYGGSRDPADSMAVYRAAYDVWHCGGGDSNEMQSTSYGMFGSGEMGAPTLVPEDPDTKYPYVFAEATCILRAKS